MSKYYIEDLDTYYEVVFEDDRRYHEDICEIKGPVETPEKTLDLHQMLDDIRHLVENDFCFDMDLKTMPNSKEYTQDEAKQMAWIIAKVYSIAHCTTCEACQRKYLK